MTKKPRCEKEVKHIETPEEFYARFGDRPKIIQVLNYIIEKTLKHNTKIEKAQELLDKQTAHADRMVQEIRKFEDRHRDELEEITGIRFGKYADCAANYFYHDIDRDFYNDSGRYYNQFKFYFGKEDWIYRTPELKGFTDRLTLKQISKEAKISQEYLNRCIKILINKRVLEVKKYEMHKFYKVNPVYIDFYYLQVLSAKKERNENETN